MKPPLLIITRGLPASGKSTWAKSWVEVDPSTRARVNRDDLRASLYGMAGVLPSALEVEITKVQTAMVRSLLESGVDVVVDDTNLKLRYARRWADLAAELDVEFDVLDFSMPVETCIERDRERGLRGERKVGERPIRNLASRFKFPLPEVKATPKHPGVKVLPYVPDTSKPRAWIVDIDGTLSTNDGRRGWYEWSAVGRDLPRPTIVNLVRMLWRAGNEIIVMSGRDAVCEEITLEWLIDQDVPFDRLLMRPEGDIRRDDVVKAELFDQYVRHDFNVVGVLDDRDQVVAMWRSMGLDCLQVNYGNF